MPTDLKKYIRSIRDFPIKGIMFRDITTLLKDPVAVNETLKQLLSFPEDKKVDKVVGIESRGFIFGAMLANQLNAGFVPVRKPGKLPAEKESAKKYGFAHMQGSHAIGHTRMATESAVTTEHSQPFTPAPDMCLVHNGSLSNHNNLRKWLRKQGQEFDTDNDSEVAARYFAHRLAEGATLKEAMEAGLTDLDGFFTFTMGTKDGFAVLRDGIACKPAVLAENDDWVAMASEFRSLAYLPNIEKAKIWEPAPATVYSWSLH